MPAPSCARGNGAGDHEWVPRDSFTIRPLTDADAETAGRLGREAFGHPDDPAASFGPVLLPGRRTYGAFAGASLVAKVVDREFESWFGGSALPTAGIAGVAVSAEYRGRGLMAPLFAAALAAARSRGVLVSGLFPTQPGIYRRLGYELVTSFDTVAVPTQVLAQVARPDGVIVRRGVETDAPAVLAVYEAWAQAQNGALSRRGGSFARILDELRSTALAVTVAERDGQVVGFACWERGQHYGVKAALEVTSLHAGDPEAMAALLHTLGSFASAVPLINLRTSGDDLSRLLLRAADWQVVDTHPYMIKVLDVAGVLSALSYPAGVATEVEFTVAGDSVDENNVSYRLVVRGGRGICERRVGVSDGPILSPRGLALIVAGAQSCTNARFAGLIAGPAGSDTLLDALFGGRQCHIRDYY